MMICQTTSYTDWNFLMVNAVMTLSPKLISTQSLDRVIVILPDQNSYAVVIAGSLTVALRYLLRKELKHENQTILSKTQGITR
uniref:Uncharacterized protein n=1 Tax=Streptococcus pyogenes TaxID=1314 RepID=A0A088F7B4_STRPY|nr:hypothetical protein SpyCIM25_18 [Streptococcus pyogenes]